MPRRIALGLLWVMLCGCAALAPRPHRAPVIDMHLHAYPAQMDLGDSPTNPRTGEPTRVKTGADHMAATLTEMERLNVVRGIVSRGAGTGMPDAAVVWSRAAPERITASVRFDGNDDAPLPDLKAVAAGYAAGAYGAMGEIGAQYAGLSLSDARFAPYLKLAEKLGIPVGVHTGISFPGISYRPCCRNFRTHFGNPQTVEEALNRHPRLKLYLMHAGWPWLQETIAMMSVYPQLYADVAVVNWIIPRETFYAHLKALVDADLGKRLMYGSDQMRWPEMMETAIASIEDAPFLTPEQKRDILCGNAARFLELEGERNPCGPEPKQKEN